MCGFHLRSPPKVCRVAIIPNSLWAGISLNMQWVFFNCFNRSFFDNDLFTSIHIVFLAATNNRLSRVQSCLNQFLSSSGIVKTMCLWGQSRQKEVALAASCLAYLTPQALQNLEWHEWGIMFQLSQSGHSNWSKPR